MREFIGKWHSNLHRSPSFFLLLAANTCNYCADKKMQSSQFSNYHVCKLCTWIYWNIS